MNLAILLNADSELLEDDPGRVAREDVNRVARALAEALLSKGLRAELITFGADPSVGLERLFKRRPDVALNLCESLGADSRGEMAIPSLLEGLGIPYTGTGALGLGLALHKNKAKELLLARGVSTPPFAVVSDLSQLAAVRVPFPAIVKPAREDASVGIDFDSVVRDPKALERAVKAVHDRFGQPALVEAFIAGREIYVPLLGNAPREALPLSEIQFGKAFEGKPNIVSYKAKWECDSPEFVDSNSGLCALDAPLRETLVQTARAAFEALECRDYGRVDLRLSADNIPFVIDVNPNCDLNPEAGFAKAAQAAGIDYATLAFRLVEIALERQHEHSSHHLHGSRTPGAAASPDRELHPGGGGLRAGAH